MSRSGNLKMLILVIRSIGFLNCFLNQLAQMKSFTIYKAVILALVTAYLLISTKYRKYNTC